MYFSAFRWKSFSFSSSVKSSVFDVINQIKDQVPDGPEIQNIIQFLSDSKRGIMCK